MKEVENKQRKKIEKISKTRSWQVNKKRESESVCTSNNRNEKGDVSTDPVVIKN